MKKRTHEGRRGYDQCLLIHNFIKVSLLVNLANANGYCFTVFFTVSLNVLDVRTNVQISTDEIKPLNIILQPVKNTINQLC